MILILDNYDSFTYNLVHSIEGDQEIEVIRNDVLTPDEAEKLKPDYLIISPGPGYPKDAGYSIDYVKYFKDKIPILGICLGHQAICEAFGANIIKAKEIKHGMKDNVSIYPDDIFLGLNSNIDVGRYHSLAVDRDSLPDELEVISESDDHEVMAVKHKYLPIWGIQFHPESIMTKDGKKILKNFLEGKNDTGSNC